jgi:hypothetical protein
MSVETQRYYVFCFPYYAEQATTLPASGTVTKLTLVGGSVTPPACGTLAPAIGGSLPAASSVSGAPFSRVVALVTPPAPGVSEYAVRGAPGAAKPAGRPTHAGVAARFNSTSVAVVPEGAQKPYARVVLFAGRPLTPSTRGPTRRFHSTSSQ